MVLAAGLTSRREPASHSRQLRTVAGFANVASVFIRDAQIEHQHLTDDPDDDYLAHAALRTGAFLVTRDDAANFGKVEGLRVGRPGTALRMIGAFDEGEVG